MDFLSNIYILNDYLHQLKRSSSETFVKGLAKFRRTVFRSFYFLSDYFWTLKMKTNLRILDLVPIILS